MGQEDEKGLAKVIGVVTAPMMSVDAIIARADAVKSIMSRAMTDGVDYGVIAKGMKPTLLKAGAEKLLLTFQIAPQVSVEELSTDTFIRFRCKVSLNSSTGVFLGDGVGECSTMEDKYLWQKATKEEYEAADPTGRRKLTLPSKYKEGTTYDVYQVKQNPFNLANTVLKMAKKRALIDAVLTVLGVSDIFTQDVEDMEQHDDKPPAGMDKATGEVPMKKAEVPFTKKEEVKKKHPTVDEMKTFAMNNFHAIGWSPEKLWKEVQAIQPDADHIDKLTEDTLVALIKNMNDVYNSQVTKK